MIYTPLTYKAMRIAYDAHHGQTDPAGVPYIFHPFHLAEQMTDELSVCTALLHDVIEDTEMTLKDLSKDFPDAVIGAVALLTHDKGTDYFDYVRQLSKNPLARSVKLADLAHNSDESRLTAGQNIPEEKVLRWRKKYALAKKILEESV